MKKLSFFLAAIFPYVFLAGLLTIFFASQIIDIAFLGNGLLFVGVLALLLFAMFAWTVVFSVFHLIKKDLSAKAWARAVMIVKLVQIPAYLLFFVLGILLFITLFTIPFALAIVAVDLLCITLTGLLGTVTCLHAAREGQLTVSQAVLMAILQFVFCADVVVSVILYSILKKSA